MEINATFLVSAASFILFTIIMNAIFYKPLGRVVEERQKFVDENYKEANSAKEKSNKILTDKEQKIEQSKHNAKKIIADKTDEVKNQKIALTSEAQQKAGQKIDLAKEELQKSTSDVQEVLPDKVVDLAQEISSKILGEKIEIKEFDKDSIKKMVNEG